MGHQYRFHPAWTSAGIDLVAEQTVVQSEVHHWYKFNYRSTFVDEPLRAEIDCPTNTFINDKFNANAWSFISVTLKTHRNGLEI